MSDKSRCAWCNPDCRKLPISHGICPDCAERLEAEARQHSDKSAGSAAGGTGQRPDPAAVPAPHCQRGIA